MYYNNKPKGFRPASGGTFNRNTIRKPAYRQAGPAFQFRSVSSSSKRFNSRPGYGGSRGGRGGQGAHESKLRGQVDIFIKRAQTSSVKDLEVSTKTFADFNISDYLKVNIQNKGYTVPTPIQEKTIPAILEGRDLIGLANTGTGKTAAFLIPIINKIDSDKTQKAFIITPTRELAVQINDEIRAFAQNMGIYTALLIGGSNMHRQMSDLRRNPHIVIGTPGRLRDLIERRALHLNNFQTFVLDEVDLMVDIGFINDVKYFISFLPEVRQSLFFSATISSKIREILSNFVKNPITVSVKMQDTAENVDQDVVKVVNRDKKIDQLHDLLIKDEFEKVLIFGKTKHGIEKLHRELDYRGFKVGAIHGNKTQGHRQRVLQNFKTDQINILLATDVASRGLDIPDVSHVINYDLPQTYDDYIHRIGRTGRAGKTGIALTFVE